MDADVVWELLVSDPTTVHAAVFRHWLAGHTAHEAARALVAEPRFVRGASSARSASSMDAIAADTQRQFHELQALETYMQHPQTLVHQQLMRFSGEIDVEAVVGHYYDFDAALARELIGRKISSGLRRDVEKMADRAGIALSSARRQFENFRRIFKRLEDDAANFSSSNLQKHFCLPPALAQRYMRVLFLSLHRVETTKRRLSTLSFDDLDAFSALALEDWTAPGTCSIDRVGFAEPLREVKTAAAEGPAMDRYRTAVRARLTSVGMGKAKVSRIDGRFRSLVRAVVGISADVCRASELRNVLADVVDKVADTMTSKLELGADEAEAVFDALSNEAVGTLVPSGPVADAYRRFLHTVSRFVVRIIPRLASSSSSASASSPQRGHQQRT